MCGTVDLETELLQLSSKARKFHSSFQVENFMVRHSTYSSWGEYNRVLRELSTRRHAQRLGSVEMKRLELTIDNDQADALDREEARIQLDELEASHTQRHEEIVQLLDIARPLDKAYGNLSKVEQNELERKEWIVRLRTKALLEIATMGRVTMDTIETVLCLDGGVRDDLFASFTRPADPKLVLAEISSMRD